MTDAQHRGILGVATVVAGVLVAGLLGPGTASATTSEPLLATGTIAFPVGADSGQVLAFADPNATAATFGTGVDLPVLKVSAQTGFGSDEIIHYRFDHKAEIVGNDVSGPVHSSRVEADSSWRVCIRP